MARAYDTTQAPAEEPIEVPAMRARGGSWGRHIFWVLVISSVLAAIALFASFAIFSKAGVDGAGGQVSDPAGFETPQQPVLQNPQTSPSGTR